MVRIEVQDTGVGIPAAYQHRIFEPFVAIPYTNPIAFRGMQVGLAIAKHLTESNGGHISFESAEGVGSTFRISFPPLNAM